MMKKLLLVLAAVFALSAGTTAFATDPELVYNNEDNANQVEINTFTGVSDYTTVIIAKGDPFPASVSSSDIVYINQFESNALSLMTNFLIKQDPADGVYTALFGNASGQNKTATFRIGSFSKTETEMDKLGVEPTGYGLNKVGFKLNAVSLEGYDVITVKIGDKMGGYNLSDVFGSINSTVNLALQIDNVPDEYVDSIKVYLGSGTLDVTYVNDWTGEAE
jgi:hypothetical protein